MTVRRALFLVGGGRRDGSTEQLARIAAQGLPEGTAQVWVNLNDSPLPPFEDLRHGAGSYPLPAGSARMLLDETLAATDIVFVRPLYWYGPPAPIKRYLDEWSAWLRLPGVHFREQMSSKRFWVISVSSGPHWEAQPMFEMYRLCAEYCGASLRGTLLGNGSKPGEALNDPQVLRRARSFFG